MKVCVNSPMRSSGQLAGGTLPSRRKHPHSQNSHELSLPQPHVELHGRGVARLDAAPRVAALGGSSQGVP